MKKFKKISLVIAIAFIGIAIISGCGRNRKSDTTETISIGVVVPLTGNAGVLGDYTLKGLQYIVDEQNSKGGLLGKKIELDIQDSKADPKEGVSIIKKMMVQKSKPFLVYSIMSGVTQAIKPETEANKIILMSAVGTDKFLENSKYTIRNYVAATTIGKELSQFLKDTMIVSNLTIFYSNNEYGKSVKDAVVKSCTEKKINVLTEPFEETSLDYKSLIAAKINKNTECVYVAGVGTGLGTMFKQIKESGYIGKLISDQLITFPDVEKAAGSTLKGIPYLDFAFDPNSKDTTIQKFVTGFESKFTAPPQNFSVITYDGVKLLFSTIEKAGTLDSDELINELNKVQAYKGIFGPVSVSNRNINFHFIFKTWE
jgi:branched-chain amino acid transport system substrate-binding protein